MNPASAGKSAIDRALDAGVYAPIGFLIRRTEVCDDAVAAGRKQVAFARSLGRAALKGFARGTTPAASAKAPAKAPVVSAAVPDYDAMSAREVLAFVKTAPVEQLRWIQTRESAGKNRVTVQRAIDSRLG